MILDPACNEIRGHCAMEHNDNRDFYLWLLKTTSLTFNFAPSTILILNNEIYKIEDLMKLFFQGELGNEHFEGKMFINI